MRVTSLAGSNRMIALCGVVGVACPAAAAMWLFVEAASGNGGDAGNILRVGFGMMLLLTAVFVLGIGAIYLKSSRSRSSVHTSA